MSVITSTQTLNRINQVFEAFNLIKKELNIGNENDILKDIDSDIEDSELSEIQLKERSKRSNIIKEVLNLQRVDQLNNKNIMKLINKNI